MPPVKKAGKGRKAGAKKNVFTELFEEEEKKARGDALGSDEEEAPVAKQESGVALFDIDVYGRKTKETQHAAGFGREKRQTSLDLLDVASESPSSVEEEEEEEELSEKEEDLEDALFDEWDMMALERARRAADDGYGYFWDGLGNEPKADRGADPTRLPRVWESSFFITSFQNIETRPQFFFYVITFGHVNKNRRITGILRRRVLYSPGFALAAGQFKPLSSPLPVWPKKILPISYGELQNYAIGIDMWKVSEYTFNTLYAQAVLTLREVVDMDPDITIMLQRKLPDKKRAYEIQRIKASIQISEIFDFDLLFESWAFTPSKSTAPAIAQHLKLLKFIIPKGHRKGWKVKWTEGSTSGFWSAPFNFVFKGSHQQLSNAYFIVKVYAKNPQDWYPRPALIGTALMSLRSVVTYPLFRSSVKQLTTDEAHFNQGEIIGNIRCFFRSTGLPYFEDPSVVRRPEQPLAGAALVTQLDLKEQFLVIRLFRCENLPASNTDSGTSDPVVKVQWDGMTNTTVVRHGTLRPIYNQNLYFPIRLLDPRERTVPYLIAVSSEQGCLPLDLLSKGNVIFDVWDKDETSSDFLGGCELSLADILNKGERRTRCLVHGLGQAEGETAKLPDGRPAAFQYKGEDAVEVDVALLEEGPAAGAEQPYEKPYLTHVYTGSGVGGNCCAFCSELLGATIATSAANRPIIFFEAFIIPPLPEELTLPAPKPVKEEQDIWKQWTKRWERDFTRWHRTYLEWFPEAIPLRRFICTAEHPQTKRLHPLPAFVVPISVPEQISEEGDLLHWICNMTFLVTTKQLRTGELPRWLSPNYFLITRKGGTNDHAVLLCSCLLGLNMEAYVCKGTINDGKDEHCWVMTRHEDGWVVFWEVTTKKRYHLPARWGYTPSAQLDPAPLAPRVHPNPDMSKTSPDEENAYYNGQFLDAWYAEAAAQCGVNIAEPETTVGLTELQGDDVVPDIKVKPEELKFETVEDKVEKRRTTDKADTESLRRWMATQRNNIPVAPNIVGSRRNKNDPSTLAYVPYSSIEVIFNNEQLWGNMQNHHPACITYDLEDPWLWRTFLKDPPKPIDSVVFIAPSTRDKACEVLRDDIQADLAENIRVYRARRGLDTQLDHGETKAERLDKFLDLLEFRLRLDPDYDPGPPEGHQAWSAWGRFESVENMQDYTTEWYSHLQKDPAQLTLYGVGAQDWADSAQQATDERAQEVFSSVQAPQYEQRYEPQALAAGGERPSGPPRPAAFQPAAVHGAEFNDTKQEAKDNTTEIKLCDDEASMATGNLGQISSGVNLHPVLDDGQERIKEDASWGVSVLPDQQLFGKHQVQGGSVVGGPDHSTPMLCRGFSRGRYPAEGFKKQGTTFLTAANFSPHPEVPVQDRTLTVLTPEDSGSESDPQEDNKAILEFCRKKHVRLASGVQPIPPSPRRLDDHVVPSDETPLIAIEPTNVALAGRTGGLVAHPECSAAVTTLEAETHHHLARYLHEPEDGQEAVIMMVSGAKEAIPQATPKEAAALTCSHGDAKAEETVSDSSVFPSVSFTLRKEAEAEPDTQWDRLQSLFGGISRTLFSREPRHEMIMDDYEAFEARRAKPVALEQVASPVPSGLPGGARVLPGVAAEVEERKRPVGPPSKDKTPRNVAHADSERLRRILERPPEEESATPLKGGLDIAELGFERTESLKPDAQKGALQKPRPKRVSTEEEKEEAVPGVPSTRASTAGGERGPDAGETEAGGGPLPPQVHRRPVMRAQYQNDQTAKWNYFYRMEALYYEWQKARFPVKPSHTFCGFPLHFSTTDPAHLRSFLLASKRFRKVMEIPIDGVIYIVRAKIYPLMGGVVSVWVFIGCEIHWAGKRERQTRMKRPTKKKQRARK